MRAPVPQGPGGSTGQKGKGAGCSLYHTGGDRIWRRKRHPLQCSCLENPRDGALWAAVCGVAQSRTRLKRLSSSSSSNRIRDFPGGSVVKNPPASAGHTSLGREDRLGCWRRLLRVSWTARRSKQSILKEINPEYSLEGLMLKVKLQYFAHLM